MALPNSGGGYQVGDGNLNEIDLYATASQQTATATATLTVAQITGNLLVGNPSHPLLRTLCQRQRQLTRL